MLKNIKIPTYSILVIFLPFLFFLIGNFYDLNLSQLKILLGVPFIISVLIYIFLYLILRAGIFKEPRLIAVYLSIVIFIIFNYRLMGLGNILFLISLIFIPIILTFFINKEKNIEKIFSVTIISMTLVCLVQVTILFYSSVKISEVPFKIYENKIFEEVDKPNIYSITLDGYSRSDQLLEIGFDNTDFEKFLEENNFFIAKEASANYTSTFTSMHTFWMMNYIDVKQNYLDININNTRNALLGKNNILSILKKIGYQHIRMGPNQAQLQDCNGNEDFCLYKINETDGNAAGTGRDIYVQILLMTPLDKVISIFYPNFLNRNVYVKTTIGDAYRAWNEVELEVRSPYFFEINVWQPHGPYIYNSECAEKLNITSYAESAVNKPKIIKEYIEETICANKQIKKLVNKINQVDKKAIILIQSDHGHAFFTDWSLQTNNWTKKAYDSRTSILWAARYPNKRCSSYLYRNITPVNTFRVLLACLAKKEPLLLEDKVYINGAKFSEPIFLYKNMGMNSYDNENNDS